jgi:hypothetical protein
MNAAIANRTHLPDAVLAGLRATILYVPPEEPDLFSILQLDMKKPDSTVNPRAAQTAEAPPATHNGARKGPHRAARPMGSHDTKDADLSLESAITDLEEGSLDEGSLEEHGIKGIQTPSKCPSCEIELPNTQSALEHFKLATHASKMRECIAQLVDLPADVETSLRATIMYKPPAERDAFKFLLEEKSSPATPTQTNPKARITKRGATPTVATTTPLKKLKLDEKETEPNPQPREAAKKQVTIHKVSTETALARIEAAKGIVAYADHNRHDALWQIDYDVAVHLLAPAHEDDFECPFHCRICGVTANNRDTGSAHLRGGTHMKNIATEIKKRAAAEQKAQGDERTTRDTTVRGQNGRGRESAGNRNHLTGRASIFWRCVNTQCARGFNFLQGADRAICPACQLDQSVRR